MKKTIWTVLALLAVLTLFCSAAAAEASPDKLHELAGRIGDKDNPVAWTLATTEYGVMTPPADFAFSAADILEQAKLTPVDAKETPEGEYIVLDFPDEKVRFDFFYFIADRPSYIRQVNADGSEQLYTAAMPQDVFVTPELAMGAEADALASALGIRSDEIIANVPQEEGWIRDAVVNGTVWMDDRATLEVFLEDTDNFKVLICWSSSAWEHTEWTYGCNYDAATQTLKAVHMVCDDVVTDENGEEKRTEKLDVDVDTVFGLNSEGKLVITRAGDEQLEGKTFVKVPGEDK